LERQKWILDFHFPGSGERLVQVDFKDDHAFLKLLKELGREEINRDLLKEFYEKTVEVLKFYEARGRKNHFNWHVFKDRFAIVMPAQNGYSFIFEASSLEDFFKRIKISLRSEKDLGIRANSIELDLFLDECGTK
jgi:hypothetical protein